MSDNAIQPPSAWRLEQSVSAWQQLKALYADDEALGNDEAVINEALDTAGLPHPDILLSKAIDAAKWAELRGDEADMMHREFEARRDRYRDRAEALRRLVLDLMNALEKTTHRAKLANAVVADGPKSVVILDEQLLPDAYIRTTKAPDRAMIGKALKAGTKVAGATLSLPGQVLKFLQP